MTTIKSTNPKDAVGCQKAPFSFIPGPVLAEIGLGLQEGACKYGAHNWRAMGVRYSVYFDATMRHLLSWWEGEDVDPDSSLSHITKAIASLVVLRDGMLFGNGADDRPIRHHRTWLKEANERAREICQMYPNPKERFCETASSEATDKMPDST